VRRHFTRVSPPARTLLHRELYGAVRFTMPGVAKFRAPSRPGSPPSPTWRSRFAAPHTVCTWLWPRARGGRDVAAACDWEDRHQDRRNGTCRLSVRTLVVVPGGFLLLMAGSHQRMPRARGPEPCRALESMDVRRHRKPQSIVSTRVHRRAQASALPSLMRFTTCRRVCLHRRTLSAIFMRHSRRRRTADGLPTWWFLGTSCGNYE
jgi:hypothetical protein